MGKPIKKETDDNTTRLTTVRPWFVSLVDFGANHGGKDHHFSLKAAAVKVDEAGLGPGGVCVCTACGHEIDHVTGKQCNETDCPECGAKMTRKDDVGKRVPEKDATNEDKQAALVERSESYGIEARDDANLSYSEDYPTKKSAYGDPCNLTYPLADVSNKADPGRIQSAIAKFRQNYEEYKQDTSRARVYERIVRAALDNDIDVSFDSEDPVDALLPADLKEELQRAAVDKTKGKLAAVALRAEISDIGAQLKKTTVPTAPPTPDTTPSLDEMDDLRATVKTATDSVDSLTKENSTLTDTIRKMETKLNTALANKARSQRPTSSLAGMHPSGDESTKKQTTRPYFPARYTGRE